MYIWVVYSIVSKKLLFKCIVSHIIIHSEGDPLEGWSTGVEWRADVRYAAMVVKVLINICNYVILQVCSLDHCSTREHTNSTKPWFEVSCYTSFLCAL